MELFSGIRSGNTVPKKRRLSRFRKADRHFPGRIPSGSLPGTSASQVLTGPWISSWTGEKWSAPETGNVKGEEKYPLRKSKNWTPGLLEKESLPPHFSIAADDAFPTCRLLDRPYDGSMEKGRVYVLDGFLVSDNLKISGVTVVNTDFAYTDHQPVMLEIRFL